MRASLEVTHMYDVQYGYARLHYESLKANNKFRVRRLSDLDKRGFMKAPVGLEKPEQWQGDRFAGDMTDDEIMTFLEQVVTPEIETTICDHFCAEFMITSLLFLSHGQEEDISFLWHCDTGPGPFLKIIVYLNACGGTSFIDRATTDLFRFGGYLFVEERVADLEGLAIRLGIDYSPVTYFPQANEAIIFQPSRVLHRGRVPNEGTRYVASMTLHPSLSHWRKMPSFDLLRVNPGSGFAQFLWPELGWPDDESAKT